MSDLHHPDGDLSGLNGKRRLAGLHVSVQPAKRFCRGLSTGYAVMLGFIGILLAGFAWALVDQLVLGDIWNFAIAQQASGTYLNIYSMMWRFIPVVIVFSFILGVIVTAHRSKND